MQKTVDLFKSKFGDGMLAYTMILFTHKDQFKCDLESLKDAILETPLLNKLVTSCGRRYMAIDNNNAATVETDVKQLLGMVGDMVKHNGGTCYTSDMLKQVEAEVARLEEEIREEREKKAKGNLEREQAKQEEEIRKVKDRLEKEVATREEALRKEFDEKERARQILEKEEKEKEIRELEAKWAAEKELQRKECEENMEKERQRGIDRQKVREGIAVGKWIIRIGVTGWGVAGGVMVRVEEGMAIGFVPGAVVGGVIGGVVGWVVGCVGVAIVPDKYY